MNPSNALNYPNFRSKNEEKNQLEFKRMMSSYYLV